MKILYSEYEWHFHFQNLTVEHYWLRVKGGVSELPSRCQEMPRTCHRLPQTATTCQCHWEDLGAAGLQTETSGEPLEESKSKEYVVCSIIYLFMYVFTY